MGTRMGQPLPGLDHGGLGGGATHVEGDQVILPYQLSQGGGADGPGRGPRLHETDGTLTSLFGAHDPAVGLHHVDPRAKAPLPQLRFQVGQVALYYRLDVGVEGCRAGPLILLDLRNQLGGKRVRERGELAAQDLPHPLLVQGVGGG